MQLDANGYTERQTLEQAGQKWIHIHRRPSDKTTVLQTIVE